MSLRRQNIAGQKFHKLTAIEVVAVDKRGCLWKCLCFCGNETTAGIAQLRSGKKKSCGCLKLGTNHYMWSGYQEITGSYWSRVVERAKRGGLELHVSIEKAWELFIKQERKCALSGEMLIFASSAQQILDRIQTASLDRIDSSKGYIAGNIQWIHKDLNLIKGDTCENDLLYWARKVVGYCKNRIVEKPTELRIRWINRKLPSKKRATTLSKQQWP